MSHTSHEDMVILKGQKSPTLLTQKLFMANFASLQSFPSEKFSSNDVELHHISQVTCAEATKNMYQHTSNQNVQIFHLGVTYLGYTRQFLSSRFNTEKTHILAIGKMYSNERSKAKIFGVHAKYLGCHTHQTPIDQTNSSDSIEVMKLLASPPIPSSPVSRREFKISDKFD